MKLTLFITSLFSQAINVPPKKTHTGFFFLFIYLFFPYTGFSHVMTLENLVKMWEIAGLGGQTGKPKRVTSK